LPYLFFTVYNPAVHNPDAHCLSVSRRQLPRLVYNCRAG
jgi:hypothetical protein